VKSSADKFQRLCMYLRSCRERWLHRKRALTFADVSINLDLGFDRFCRNSIFIVTRCKSSPPFLIKQKAYESLNDPMGTLSSASLLCFNMRKRAKKKSKEVGDKISVEATAVPAKSCEYSDYHLNK
jgi:hypothetical protein